MFFAMDMSNGVNPAPYAEHRQVVFSADAASPYVIEPGGEFMVTIDFAAYDYPVKRCLRITGGSQYPKPWQNRTEENLRLFNHQIEDYLDPAMTYKDETYSLLFMGEGEDFDRNAYYRIPQDKLADFAGKEAVLTIPVKRENLIFQEDGYLSLQLEVYLNKQGRHPNDIYDDPDKLIDLSVPAGSGDWEVLAEDVPVPQDVACILVKLGGKKFSGKCFAGVPKLTSQAAASPIPPYTKYNGQAAEWVGENLSSKEWPEFEFALDGERFFVGKVFDRASQETEFMTALPNGLAGKKQLTITLKDGLSARYPFALRTVEVVERSGRDFEVVFVPQLVHENKEFSILIETNQSGIELAFDATGPIQPVTKKKTYKSPGLYPVVFQTGKAGSGCVVTVSDKEREDKTVIKQVIRKTDDGVYLSLSDDIYIARNQERFSDYLRWYLREGIGNAYVWRPSYLWGGTREAPREFYQWAVPLLEGLHMPYAKMIEGRIPSGKNVNPPDPWLDGPLFWGSQSHETDGAYCYWANGSRWEWPYQDLMARFRGCAKNRPIHNEKGSFVHFDPYAFDTMEEAAPYFVSNVANGKQASTRHTGPTTLFRYILQAGYDWIGAEQMYGPEEVTMSSLRGANKAYGKQNYGTHLATQWSSAPYDAPEHATRLFLSLAISYIHGASHINTEDALWTTEYKFDRYSAAGQDHILQQRKMYHFIQTHQRRGKMVTPVAILQGRNDGWRCFSRWDVWFGKGDQWKFGPAEESMDLVNVFYPGSKLDAVYRFPCPNEPQGWYTSTPYGPIDLTPIEAGSEVLDAYQAIALLGWNTYRKEDFQRLLSYVQNGGTLLLTQAHLNTELRHDKPILVPDNDAVLNELLGEHYPLRDGMFRRDVGQGKVICFPQKLYPIDGFIRDAYCKELAAIGQRAAATERKKGWIASSENIQFAAWDWEDHEHRTIYLLNVDWWSEKTSAPATLMLDNQEFKMEVRRRCIEVVTVYQGLAVMPQSMETDILKMEKTNTGCLITVQTTGPDELTVFSKDTQSATVYNIPEAGIHTVRIQGVCGRQMPGGPEANN